MDAQVVFSVLAVVVIAAAAFFALRGKKKSSDSADGSDKPNKYPRHTDA